MLEAVKRALTGGKRQNSFHVSHRLKGPKRLPGENYEEYRYRRRYEAALLREYRKGEVIWKGKRLVEHKMMGADGQTYTVHSISDDKSQGTYIKKKHGLLRSHRSK